MDYIIDLSYSGKSVYQINGNCLEDMIAKLAIDIQGSKLIDPEISIYAEDDLGEVISDAIEPQTVESMIKRIAQIIDNDYNESMEAYRNNQFSESEYYGAPDR